ncbi:MAG: nitroreductase family protein [Candidatus Bathyarchaeota archaeon]|jgi:nitroreductase|nr:nitroreductase family protein [Candidatus Bathyarchaeota archaeon]
MDFFKTIQTRRSIRKYTSDPIPDAHLAQMLEAARLAPSAGNYQPWKFVAVRNPETIQQLVPAARNQTFLSNAAAIIIAFADANVYLPPPPREPGLLMIPPCFESDVMIAIEHLVLAATALGYGSCWIGAFNESDVKPVVSIPDRMKIVALIALGVAAENPKPLSRKPLSEIVYYEKYEDDVNVPSNNIPYHRAH